MTETVTGAPGVHVQTAPPCPRCAGCVHGVAWQRLRHDLRTPAGLVTGFAELLLTDSTGALSPDQRELVERILQSGTLLLEMLEDAGSRPEAQAAIPRRVET